MLIELKVKNFRSIRDQQTLSLVASPATELNQNTFVSGNDADLHLVRAAVVYGANAGGKSNLLSALLCMRGFILRSAKESQQGDKIPVESFLFDDASRKEPTELEVTFIKDNIRYQYGFVADENRIFEEWLFAYPVGRPQQWFSRVYDKKNKKYSWKFSKYFKGGKQVADLTRNNVLFLSNAVKLNNEQLVPIFDWFQKDLVLIDSLSGRGLDYEKSINYVKTEKGKKRILKFMNAADPSIADIVLDNEKITEAHLSSLTSSMPKEAQDFIKKKMLGQDNTKISFMHGGVSLDFGNESDGTCRLFAFAGPWLKALDEGRVLIVDEINSTLHPLVVKFLIKLICDPEVNKKNAQLVFTTHDTSLLDNELFRRDQVWFVEKDKNNSTQLYPLLDFSPRKHEAFSRGYLQGRYGALPYIGEWSF
jgi:AAA15 family ATPase/GTPase